MCIKTQREQGLAIHTVKCFKENFEAIQSEDKPFEYRKKDHDYMGGDWISFEEWDAEKSEYTGRCMQMLITYIQQDTTNLPKGYVILGISK